MELNFGNLRDLKLLRAAWMPLLTEGSTVGRRETAEALPVRGFRRAIALATCADDPLLFARAIGWFATD